MKKKTISAAAAALAGAAILGTLYLPAEAQLPTMVEGQQLPTLAPMIERVTPAVVNIATRGRVRIENPLFQDPFFRRFFDIPQFQERQVQAAGSGVIIDAKRGYVVTNNHVIENADQIIITLRDGRSLDAKLVGRDPETDVAILQVPPKNLVELPQADSDKLRVGDFVVAIGNPFGLGQTVTSGIVSALGRSRLGIEGFEDFIQTDASINPGNSGGALVNLAGELVGINTAILSPAGGNIGIGFAIPINMVRQVAAQLIEYGEVRRGQLGVIIQDLTPELAQAFGIEQTAGAVVAQVLPGSPAEKAGLQAGDIITSVNGKRVQTTTDLRNTVGLLKVGERVNLEVLRNGSKRNLQVTIGKAAETRVTVPQNPRLRGATFGPIPEGSPLSGKVQGVLVQDVQPGSPAAEAGLRPGDVITSVNRQPVRNLEEFQKAVSASKGALLLNIRRGNSAMFLLVQ